MVDIPLKVGLSRMFFASDLWHTQTIIKNPKYLLHITKNETKESIIPKVEPRLQGFKHKEIFFKNVQINEIKLKNKLV